MLNKLHGSDHFPLQLTILNDRLLYIKPDRFNTEKARWVLFRQLTDCSINFIDQYEVDALIQIIEDKIVEAAKAGIPIKKGNTHRLPLPWWSDECREAVMGRVRSDQNAT